MTDTKHETTSTSIACTVCREWERDMNGTLAALRREREITQCLLAALTAVRDADYLEGAYQPTIDMVDAAIEEAKGVAA